MKTLTKTLHILAIFSLIILTNCRPIKPSSDVKSLDNLSGIENQNGKTWNINKCGRTKSKDDINTFAPSIKILTEDKDNTLKNSLDHALAAVPSNLKVGFFHPELFNGHIVIANKNAIEKQICSQITGTNGQQNFFNESYNKDAKHFTVCWKNSPPIIYIEANPQAIEHSIVRIFSYVYSEYIIDGFLKLVSSQKEKDLKTYKQERSIMKNLAKTFLEEVSSNNKATNLSTLINLNKNDPISFENYVFADAMDSYYCSRGTNNSKDKFAKLFPKTYQAFAPYVKRFGDD